MASSYNMQILSLFLLLLAASSSSLAAGGYGDDDLGLTRIHLYVHETLAPPANATFAFVAPSPLGASSSFGSIIVVDHELRAGRDRSSQLLGRYQSLMVGTSLGTTGGKYLTSIALVFTAGEHAGSTLSVEGLLVASKGVPFERAVVGGTGKFRLARGYSLTTIIGNPTPETGLFEVELFVLMHRGGKY
ncbi:hypothetical protein HU200_046067 [Digitaria exilis]|uniref:Dirigent protein n=1 Tax=Digitaria exilis TaxID=1010633 RepID=A0A835AZA1_9POAL|nr:hypothetical protein HU200_046067 [Digitaria exilis]CAB3458620.1 unnamed protein product [Digitaria exilis]